MKNWLILGFVVGDVALIVVSLVWMLAGYLAWGGVALLAAFALVVVAARHWRDTVWPAPAEPGEWFVWDTELEDGLSDVEIQMLRRGCVPVPDPVDAHAAQMIRALSGQTAVLPEIGLLQPERPGRHRSQP